MRTGGMRILGLACVAAMGVAAAGGREPVLKQIDLPHN